MATVRVNHAEAFRFSRQVAEKQIRRALLDMKLRAVVITAHGPYTTGKLATSLEVHVELTPDGVAGTLGSRLPYAKFPEEGAESHYIFPRPPKQRLKFYWRKVGRVVKPPFVYHPGQAAKHYLTNPMIEVAPRYNMLVFVRHR